MADVSDTVGPSPAVDPSAVAERVEEVRARIARAGDPDRVRLVAVTKGFGPDAVAAALAAGVHDLGESYAPELAAKALATQSAGPEVRWHFVGRLQSNKVRRLAGVVHLWHSVDRRSVVDALARHAAGATVLVQVNVTGAPGQGGCEPTAVPELVAEIGARGLEVTGLMCVGAPGGPTAARPGFRRLHALADDLGIAECSMGMSGDLEAAVEEGATMVRVGTALFGARPAPRAGPRGGATGLRH